MWDAHLLHFPGEQKLWDELNPKLNQWEMGKKVTALKYKPNEGVRDHFALANKTV